jgi:hypothetical protein
LEIEAIYKEGSLGVEVIRKQCEFYITELNIREEDFVVLSYSDLLLVKHLPDYN